MSEDTEGDIKGSRPDLTQRTSIVMVSVINKEDEINKKEADRFAVVSPLSRVVKGSSPDLFALDP
jgi:hypothetical protein